MMKTLPNVDGHRDTDATMSRPHRGRPGRAVAGRIAIAVGVVLGIGFVSVGATPSPAPTPTRTPIASTPPKSTKKAGTVTGIQAPKVVTASAKALVTPQVAQSATLPATCGLAGTTRTCDLYAQTGTITVPGVIAGLAQVSPQPASGPRSIVPIWGFSLSSAAGSGTLPGPTLVATQNETLVINLHDSLPSGSGNLALEVPQLDTTNPDSTGTTVGGVRTYTFSLTAPGTMIYEAGQTDNESGNTDQGARQVAMGLAGMLVVRPSTWTLASMTAYGDASSTYTAESPVELNEIDTGFNRDPFGSDLHHYQPNVFMVNGVAFDRNTPTTGAIPVSPGDQLLLRYADLGIKERSMTVENARQTELASDAHVLKAQPNLAAMYLNPVQTTDAITTIDPTAPLNTLIPLYDQGHHFTLPGGGLGGMVTMLNVVNGLAGVPGGPVTTAQVDVVLPLTSTPISSPQTNDGRYDTVVTGTITSQTGSAISRAEWFFDAPGTPGTGTPVALVSTGPSSAKFTFKVSAAQLGILLANPALGHVNGEHVFWVHAQDATGAAAVPPVWGVVSGDLENVNIAGPVVPQLSVSVHSTPTNGTTKPNDIDGTPNLVVIGTAAASLPGWDIVKVETCIDLNPCADDTGTQLPLITTTSALVGNLGAPITGGATVTSLPLASPLTQALANGLGLTVSDPAGDTFAVTATAPSAVGATSIPVAAVNPPTVTFPTGSPISQSATVGANGPDAAVVAFAGSIDGSGLAVGPHKFWIHACEAPPPAPGTPATTCPPNGRYNQTSVFGAFNIDRTGPVTTITKVDPDPTNGTLSGNGNVGYIDQERIDATFSDAAGGASAISLAEVFMLATTNPQGHIISCSTTVPTDAMSGTGAEMVPTGAKWNVIQRDAQGNPVLDANGNTIGMPVSASAFIPLGDVRACPEGKVRFYVHSMDSAGNWGPFATFDMTLDKTPPILDSATASAPAGGKYNLTINAHDPVSGGVSSNITQAEYFYTPCAPTAESSCFSDPGIGNGTQITVPGNSPTLAITVTGIPVPPTPAVLFVRVKDQAGNWTAVDLTASDFNETNEHEIVEPPTETIEDYGPVAHF